MFYINLFSVTKKSHFVLLSNLLINYILLIHTMTRKFQKYQTLCHQQNFTIWIADLAQTNFVNNVFVFVFLGNSSLLQILFLTCVGLLFIIPVYIVFVKSCHLSLGWLERNICWTIIQTSSRLTNPTHYLYLKQLLCKI